MDFEEPKQPEQPSGEAVADIAVAPAVATPIAEAPAEVIPEPVNPALAREEPDIIVHKKCGTKTKVGQDIATKQRAHNIFLTMPCHKCGWNHPVAEFTWAHNQKPVSESIAMG